MPPQVTLEIAILDYCTEPRSKTEIMKYCGYKHTYYFFKKHLSPLLQSGQLRMTIPDMPKSRNQRYVATSTFSNEKEVKHNITNHVSDKVSDKVTPQVTSIIAILEYCKEPRSREEIMKYCGYEHTYYFFKKHLSPLLQSGQLQMTIPDKPHSRNQKYVTVKKTNN